MFSKWLPKETSFFDLFEQHAEMTLKAAQILHQCMLSDQIHFKEDINPIKALEHQADQITHQCIDTLHKSFITPLQQDDIFHLISCMDDVMDCIDEVFDDCLIYEISSFTPAAREMGQLLVLATEKLNFVIRSLRDRKKQASLMRKANRQIHQLENQADDVLHMALGKLFNEEKDLRLLIKWKEIYEGLEKAMDTCDDVSNVIEGIIVGYD